MADTMVHFGVIGDDVLERLDDIDNLLTDIGVHWDGDSFREWGEMLDDGMHDGDAAHLTIRHRDGLPTGEQVEGYRLRLATLLPYDRYDDAFSLRLLDFVVITDADDWSVGAFVYSRHGLPTLRCGV